MKKAGSMSSKKVSRKDAKSQSKEEEPMSKKTKALGASASLREPEKQDSKPTLVPKLRFPEFRGAAESRKRSRQTPLSTTNF